MTWLEHPRIVKQREQRQKMLAGIQWKYGFSREEMAEYFQNLAEAKTNGFKSIEEYNEHLASQKKPKEENTQQQPQNEELSGADYALHNYRPSSEW